MFLVLLAHMFAGVVAHAQTLDVDTMDNMTPDELAQVMGVAAESEDSKWFSQSSELLFVTEPMVNIRVSIAHQAITVASPEGVFSGKVSSGIHDHWPRGGEYRSRRGCYTPYSLLKMHYSKKFDDAP